MQATSGAPVKDSHLPQKSSLFAQILALAHQSLRQVLATGNNTADLLNLHIQQTDARPQAHGIQGSHGRIVVTKERSDEKTGRLFVLGVDDYYYDDFDI